MKVVKFAYYDEFSCIVPECTDSCCKNWRITLTKREYLNYKKMDCSPELRSIIDTAFKRTRKDDLSYAEIKLNENGDCPFLGEDSLCKIQKEKGVEALSIICNCFPRKNTQVGSEAFIYSGNITCSHIVELMMKHPEGLAIAEEDYKGDNPMTEKNLFSGNIITNSWEGYPYFWTIKNAQLDILQNRNFTVPERMLILGFFAQKADEYIKEHKGEKIGGLANMLLDNETCKKIADSLKAPQSEEDAAVKSADILLKMKNTVQDMRLSNPKTLEYFEQVATSIDLRTEVTENNNIGLLFDRQKYSDNLRIYREIENNRPYIIENLLVNLAFADDPQQGIWTNFFVLAIFYNTLKLCIPAFLKENWNDRDLALAITYSAKIVLNTHLADKGTIKDFMNNNSFDLPHAAFLMS